MTKVNPQGNKGSFYHKRRKRKLCRRHCLNNLLQGEICTCEQLNAIAVQIDGEEQELFEWNFNNGRPNYESLDTVLSRFFSCALEFIGIELVKLGSEDPRAIASREETISECFVRKGRAIGVCWELRHIVPLKESLIQFYLIFFGYSAGLGILEHTCRLVFGGPPQLKIFCSMVYRFV